MSKSFADEFLNGFEELALPPELSERFDALERLAQNEYGETFLIAEKDGGKRFVLKCYKKTAGINAVHEAELLRGLEHKGLPRFETEIETEDTLFVLREYIDGLPLDMYLADGQVDEAQAVNIITELCEILSYLHSQPAPIIHRDIKPSNIIIDPRNKRVMLIDFGISRKYSEDAEADTSFFGTQRFAPPEQYGFSQTDCRADIYALGVVLRYMLTGTTDKKVGVKDKSLERVIAKCDAFSPDERFKSAAALKKALIKYEKRTKEKTLIALGAVFAACLVFVAGFSAGRYTDILSFNPTDPNETVYHFSEPLIEKAVRVSLGKADAQPITNNELRNVRELYIVGEEAAASESDWRTIFSDFQSETRPYGTLKSLEDLSVIENLENLTIVAQPLSDLSPLIKNTRLNRIFIVHCNVSDISPLTGLPRLKDLTLYDNQIDSFSAFGDMKSLRFLDIGNSALNSLYELDNLAGLESLLVHRTQISNLNGIERFPTLESLNISDTAIHDFSALNKVPYLKTLYIGEDMEEYLSTLTREDIKIILED